MNLKDVPGYILHMMSLLLKQNIIKEYQMVYM